MNHNNWKLHLEKLGFKLIYKSKGKSWYFSNGSIKIRVSNHFNTKSDADFSLTSTSVRKTNKALDQKYKEQIKNLIDLYE